MQKKPPEGPKKLEAWQKEDAARLAALFKRTPLSQEAFGFQFGIGTQGAVSQYLNGLIALNLTAALRFAKGLGVSVADISPTLAKEIEGLGDPRGAALSGALGVLSKGSQKELLNYIQYHIQKDDIASDVRKHYIALVEQLKEQLEFDLGFEVAANDAGAPVAKKETKFKTIKGRKS